MVVLRGNSFFGYHLPLALMHRDDRRQSPGQTEGTLLSEPPHALD